MEPEYVQCAFSTATTTAIWRGSPLSTMSTLRVLPLGFNSSLEAMKVCTCAQLAWWQHIIVEAADYQQKIVTTNISDQLQPILIHKSMMCTFQLSQCLNILHHISLQAWGAKGNKNNCRRVLREQDGKKERRRHFRWTQWSERRRKIATKTGRQKSK